MKTKVELQQLFDSIVSNLEGALFHNLVYAFRDFIRWDKPNFPPSPLTSFLEELNKSAAKNYDELFFTHIYKHAFYIGPIPKNRNHIALSCNAVVSEEGDKHNIHFNTIELHFWIDLDKLAAELNAHYKIKPPYQFKFQYREIKSEGNIDRVYFNKRIAVNSFQYKNTLFLISLGVHASVLSALASAILILALFSFITINIAETAVIATLGILAAATACYCFFNIPKKTPTHAVTVPKNFQKEPKPICIEEIFKTHFEKAHAHTQFSSFAAA